MSLVFLMLRTSHVVFPACTCIRACIMQERHRAPTMEYLYLRQRHTSSRAQIYSPNYPRAVTPPRVCRRSCVAPQLFPSLLSSIYSSTHLHGMHSYEIDHSSADFSPTVFFFLSLLLFFYPPFSLHLPFLRHARVRDTSSSSLCGSVNPTEDTRDVTRVVENWFVGNDDVRP